MKFFRYSAAIFLICLVLLRAGTATATYVDTESHWASDAIAFVTDAGLMDGLSDYTFGADAPATRACIMQALYRLAPDTDINIASSFDDVPADASYYDAVQWGAYNDIIEGVGDGQFEPGGSLAREQLAAMVYRYAALKQADLSLQNDLSLYTDAGQISGYALTAMQWANAQGLILGTSDTALTPQGTVTRAQLATILQRLSGLLGIVPQAADPNANVQSHSYTAFTTFLGPVTRAETRQSRTEVCNETRSYSDAQGCVVEMGRSTASLATPAHIAAQFRMEGQSGTVRWYDVQSARWYEKPLSSGVLPRGMYFIRVNGIDSIVVTPQTYCAHENGMIEYIPSCDGTLAVTQENGGFTFSLKVTALQQGTFSDYLVLTSSQQLIDWTDADELSRWSNYRFTDDNRWCYDGYYYTAPDNYYPYGPNYFHSLPGAYIACKMARDADQPASRALGLAMIDIMREQQNEYGFIPSLAGSTWLKDDYSIDPGYFDTRFNTDLWLANINAAENFGVTEWLDQTKRYADFLVSHTQAHHYSFGSGDSTGWLVEDYWHPNGLGKPTHASLNHHTAEAVFLYRFSTVTGDESYAALADCMVRGIESTVSLWILPDGNLNYSYKPDRTASGTDYPYLTYNDLLEVQHLYTLRHGSPSSGVARLMDSKRAWMDKNGITEYNRTAM